MACCILRGQAFSEGFGTYRGVYQGEKYKCPESGWGSYNPRGLINHDIGYSTTLLYCVKTSQKATIPCKVLNNNS